MINGLFSNPISFVFYLISLFAALSVHEAAHAWMADRLGDPTARLQGRITLNPLKHIDLYGLIFLVFFGFGWGRPVEYDPFNLKNPRKDGAIISFAGPASNILFALILSIILRLFNLFQLSGLFIIGSYIAYPLIIMNVSLGLFNLIPIHPLDGFSIVGGILPREKAEEWLQLRRYGMIFLILLIIPVGSGSMLSSILQPAASFVINLLVP